MKVDVRPPSLTFQHKTQRVRATTCLFVTRSQLGSCQQVLPMCPWGRCNVDQTRSAHFCRTVSWAFVLDVLGVLEFLSIGVPSSFLFLVVRPGAPSTVLAPFVAMPFAPSSVPPQVLQTKARINSIPPGSLLVARSAPLRQVQSALGPGDRAPSP